MLSSERPSTLWGFQTRGLGPAEPRRQVRGDSLMRMLMLLKGIFLEETLLFQPLQIFLLIFHWGGLEKKEFTDIFLHVLGTLPSWQRMNTRISLCQSFWSQLEVLLELGLFFPQTYSAWRWVICSIKFIEFKQHMMLWSRWLYDWGKICDAL